MYFKKLMAVITALAMASGMLAGCSEQKSGEDEKKAAQTTSAENVEDTEKDNDNGNVKIVNDVTEGLKAEGTALYNEEEKYKALNEKLKDQLIDASQPKGVAMLATDEDIIMIRSFNSTETDGTTPTNAYTTYEIGSITKSMTATAILQLIEEGKLNLDDTLDKFFPEYKHGDKITICHLLHMQSGIYDNLNETGKIAELKGWDKEDIEKLSEKYIKDAFTDEEIVAITSDLDLKFEPGSEYAYSNTGYFLLALMIEQTTGKPYAEYLQEHVFDVCGMEHSSSAAKGDLTSIPYDKDEASIAPMVDENGYSVDQKFSRGAGGVHSCAADLLMFDRSLFGGTLLGEDSMAAMFDIDKSYGCGWTTLDGTDTCKHYMHNGRQGSYLSSNAVFDTEEYGRVYFIQLYSQSTQSIAGKMITNNNIVKSALGE